MSNMNIVMAGPQVRIYGEEISVSDHIPTGTYDISFSKMSGFSLIQRSPLTINEEKIYGNHKEKVEKVMRGFHATDRNFGILLSGHKGIGKSLFARVLSERCLEEGIPVIVASNYIPGITSFISSIDQEVMVLMDEYEKNFTDFTRDDGPSAQEEMLSLFDGIDGGKKLFCITCNEIDRLNGYLLNRPGRFHYHFRITFPTADEIWEYMNDKVKPEFKENIQEVISFSYTSQLTFDHLNAIAFDINMGYKLSEILEDLNITREIMYYSTVLTLSNGEIYTGFNRVDYNDRINSCDLKDESYKVRANVEFVFSDGVIGEDGAIHFSPDKLHKVEMDEPGHWDFDLMDKENEYLQMSSATRDETLNYAKTRWGDVYVTDFKMVKSTLNDSSYYTTPAPTSIPRGSRRNTSLKF